MDHAREAAVHDATATGMSTSRIEAFSDGVFAIVVTLLVLELRVPALHGPNLSASLRQALLQMAPRFLSYGLSFAITCIWWVAHHHFFAMLKRSNRGLLWLNSLFLFWLASVPFPTALLGNYPHETIAVMCYGAVMTLAGVTFSTMRYYACFKAKLVDPRIDPRLLKSAMRKSVMNPVLHSVAIVLALVDRRLALGLYVLIPALFMIPSRLEKAIFSRT
jgi:TMEM175 potassium channel family protein